MNKFRWEGTTVKCLSTCFKTIQKIHKKMYASEFKYKLT